MSLAQGRITVIPVRLEPATFLFRVKHSTTEPLCSLLSLKINFVLANSADPDEMVHDAAFHLGLHCLPKNRFMWFLVYKGINYHIYHKLNSLYAE